MSRVGSTALSGLDRAVQDNLLQAFNRLNQANARLATFKRINAAQDDPADLIAVESLRAELTALDEADRNAARVSSALKIADGGLGQASELINEVRGLVIQSADGFTSDAQRQANQTAIDAALRALDGLDSATSFAGRSLLDGSDVTVLTSGDPNDGPPRLTCRR